jgi:hypothetical protein
MPSDATGYTPKISFPITGSTMCSKLANSMITREQALSQIHQAKNSVEKLQRASPESRYETFGSESSPFESLKTSQNYRINWLRWTGD